MTPISYCQSCTNLDACHSRGCVREERPAPAIRPAYVRSWRGVLAEIGLGLGCFAMLVAVPLHMIGAW